MLREKEVYSKIKKLIHFVTIFNYLKNIIPQELALNKEHYYI